MSEASASLVEVIPAPDADVTIKAWVRKRCPVRDEVDDGTVTITYRTRGTAIELHSLAAYLAAFADERLSHEDFTNQVSIDLLVDVSSSWTTAGMEVTCVVLRESVNTEGA